MSISEGISPKIIPSNLGTHPLKYSPFYIKSASKCAKSLSLPGRPQISGRSSLEEEP